MSKHDLVKCRNRSLFSVSYRKKLCGHFEHTVYRCYAQTGRPAQRAKRLERRDIKKCPIFSVTRDTALYEFTTAFRDVTVRLLDTILRKLDS